MINDIPEANEPSSIPEATRILNPEWKTSPMATVLPTTLACLLFGFLSISGYAETEILVDPLSFSAGGGNPNVELDRQSGTAAPVKYSVLPSDDNPDQILFSETGLVITPKQESPEPGILTATSFTQSAELRVSIRISPLTGGFWGGIVVGCLPDDLNIWENSGFAVRVYSSGAVTLIDRGQQRLITATAPSLSYQVELEIKNPRAFDGSGTAEMSVTINGTPLNLDELGAGQTIRVDGFRSNHIMLTGSAANPPQSPAAEFRDLSVIAAPVAFSEKTPEPLPAQAQEAAQFAPIVPTASPNDRQDVVELKPDFVSLVAKEAGLWPNIVCLPDGTLLAFGYNAPAHTTLPGDVDVWASSDGGRSWEWRAAAAPRPMPTANYCHWASGLAKTGDVIVVAGGLADPSAQKTLDFVMTFLSQDAGKTWEKRDVFPHKIKGLNLYPFGSVANGADGSLRTVVYSLDDQKQESAWMVTSRDNGDTWDEGVLIAKGINESVLLSLGDKSWLCVARTSNRPPPENGQELRQFRSTDDGLHWKDEGLVAGWHKHPPSLLRLKDDRILLTYGNRRNGGIEAMSSSDDGKSWGPPMLLHTTGPGDMGYPSTTQLPDGKLVTVFYASQSSQHQGYQMRAVGWSLP